MPDIKWFICLLLSFPQPPLVCGFKVVACVPNIDLNIVLVDEITFKNIQPVVF